MKTRLTIITAFALLALAAYGSSASAAPRLDAGTSITGQPPASQPAAPVLTDSIAAPPTVASTPNGVQLRRDGSRAQPFEPLSADGSTGDGFDWTAAAIVAGGIAALGIAAVGLGATGLRRGRRPAHA
jgi:hypothetical protein